ncbi:MAG: DUF2341 domain-containing protein, partial [Verrucomicrobiota bacterium]
NLGAWANSAPVGVFTDFTGAVSFPVGGLLQGLTYYYTFSATNCLDAVVADPSTAFGIVNGAPLVDNLAGATDIGAGIATLQGNLSTGGAANVVVYWGETDGGTDATAWDHAVPIGQVPDGAFSYTVSSGLLYGIPYYYRMFASNSLGMSWASNSARFKTESPLNLATAGFRVSVYDTTFGNANLEPISNLMGITPTDVTVYTNAVFDYNNVADFQADYPALTAGDTFSFLWEGVMYIAPGEEGVYTFGTASDDGSVVYIDLNRDGDFDDGTPVNLSNASMPGGELIVDNNWNHGRTEQTGTANFTESGCYNIAIAVYEQGGGENMEFKFRKGSGYSYIQLDFVDSSPASTHPFFMDCTADPGFSLYTAAASGITTNSGTLNGGFMSSGSVQCVSLFWGANNGGTNALAWSNAMDYGCFTNAPLTAISLPVTGLLPGTEYFYALRATNCAATTWTPTESFNTLIDLDAFSFNTKITFCGYNRPETLTNFPALVMLGTNINGFAYSQFAGAGGGDLRFVSGDLSRTLNYDVETWDTNGSSFIWVQVPELVDSNTCIFAYWGNPSSTNAPGYTTNGATWNGGFESVWHLAETNGNHL